MDHAAKDFSAQKQVVIGLIDGDGIGPIIMREAKRVLEALLKEEITAGAIVLKPIEGLTIENRLALGQSVPEDVLAAVPEKNEAQQENRESCALEED